MQRVRLIAIVAVFAVAGALAASAVGTGVFDSSRPGPSWSSSEGINERAGFMAGCGQGVAVRTEICECAFARLTSIPPYTTPSGFLRVLALVKRFEATRELSVVPAAVVSGIHGCVEQSRA